MKNNDYPILVFPGKEEAERSKRRIVPPKPVYPTVGAIAKHIQPKLTKLQHALDRRMRIQQGAEGVNPEEILVLETAGKVDDFYKAVQRVEGLEWLIEEDFEGEPDEDFYMLDENGKQTDKELPSRLYLVSTNSEALNWLANHFKEYANDPESKVKRGYGKFREVFKQLRDVRFWDYKDRLDGSDFLDEWLQNNEEGIIKFQIELWFRNSEERRAEAQQQVTDLVKDSGGRVITMCVIPEIKYHALLVEVPGSEMRRIIEGAEVKSLIKCSDVMYFKQLAQTMTLPAEEDEEDIVIPESEPIDEPMPSGEPIVAIFDGFPMGGHMNLDGRLRLDDPDGFGEDYEAHRRQHGTAMSSLIIHGDLSNRGAAINTPLYVRPVMRPFGDKQECMPEDILGVDLIHRAVRRLFEGENGQPPVAPKVKIINFSIGDAARVFYRSMSPMAKLLDWLSYKYDVLFVISAGNIVDQLFPMGCSYEVFKDKSQDEISKVITNELLKLRMEHRILSPAESINNLTVGAVHKDYSKIIEGGYKINPYDCVHPSTYTRFGGGFKNSVKPDLVYDGGKQLLLAYRTSDSSMLTPSLQIGTPGVETAWPSPTRNDSAFTKGTSGATALISRHAYHCYQELEEILDAYGLPDSHVHLMIKALTVHGCSWDGIADNIEKFLPAGLDGRTIKGIKRQWIGYGYPEFDKSLLCTPQRVTVLGFGDLQNEEAHVYRMPLPPSLASKDVKRKLTVTLAWMSDVAPQTQRYRKAKLWIEMLENQRIADSRTDLADAWAPRRGTLQHEVFESELPFPFEDGDSLRIKVNCANDAGEIEKPIKYAIAVTLELGEGVDVDLMNEINIYEEVRDRLRVPIRVANTANS
jgi:hypothetical protein